MRLDPIHAQLNAIRQENKALARKVRYLMTAAQELAAKVTDLQTEVDATQLRVANVQSALEQTIADLEAAAAAGGGSVPAADVAAAVAGIQAAIDDLRTTDQPPAPPAP